MDPSTGGLWPSLRDNTPSGMHLGKDSPGHFPVGWHDEALCSVFQSSVSVIKEFILLCSTTFMASAKDHEAVGWSLLFYSPAFSPLPPKNLAIRSKQDRKQLCNVAKQFGSLGSRNSTSNSLADRYLLIALKADLITSFAAYMQEPSHLLKLGAMCH